MAKSKDNNNYWVDFAPKVNSIIIVISLETQIPLMYFESTKKTNLENLDEKTSLM